MNKLRLMTTLNCNRHCVGCCNNDWDFNKVSYCETYDGYDEILLTGGEPLLYPHRIIRLCADIRAQTDTKIYLYTAICDYTLQAIIPFVDGICLTLHTRDDLKNFIEFDRICRPSLVRNKSMRLNVFEEAGSVSKYWPIRNTFWKVKEDMEWIKNCPLPVNEVLMLDNMIREEIKNARTKK